MKKTRVLLADDHQIFREGIASILNAQSDFEVVGEAGDGLEAIVKAGVLAPDLILMDVGMPGCDGVEATRRIKLDLPGVTIVMLTIHDEDERLFEAIENGAIGYLLKNIDSGKLLAMLRGALHGESAMSPAMGGRVLREFRRVSSLAHDVCPDAAPTLTRRELEVLSLIAEGATDNEIAAALTISLHTVKSHVRAILAKLPASRRHEAALHALRRGLIRLPEGQDTT